MLSLEELQTHLRGAVEILREYGDPAEDRVLLCAWLWLKDINDECEDRFRAILHEETAAGRSEAEARNQAADPDEYRFFLPAEAKWAALAEAEGHCAEKFVYACAALENRYAHLLAGIFGQIRLATAVGTPQFSRWESLSRRLWEHFSKIDLARRHLFSPELIGAATAHMLAEIAGNSTRKKPDFASPIELMQMLAELLQPQPGMRICDPTCGAGGGLIACAQYLEQRGHNPQNLSLYGQEVDPGTWALCKLNLLLHDLPDHQIWTGNAITAPLLNDAGQLLQFDLVLAHLPFSVADWGYAAATQDPWQRFELGMPPQKRGDLAFVLHALNTLNEQGRAALVVPHGVLFRGGAEGQIRRALLQTEVDTIEAVISLPPGWLYDPRLPCAILVLNRAKATDRRGRVLFIDATALHGSLFPDTGPAMQALAIAAIFHGGGDRERVADYMTDELERRNAATESRQLRLQEVWRHEKPGYALAEKEARDQLRELARMRAALQQWQSQPAALARCFASATPDKIARSQHHYLTPAHYCVEHRAGLSLNVSQELQALQTLAAECRQAEAEMDHLLRELEEFAHA
ncbi:MAG: HsdM family class I SAM-dependent methyltransferase [bacterium]